MSIWTQGQSDLLVAILDQLIPPQADRKIPGAGTLGVAEFLPSATAYTKDPLGDARAVLDHVSKTAPDFLSLDFNSQEQILKATEIALPKEFSSLVRLTYMGYYSRPETRALVGVAAEPVHPDGYSVARESDALLDELTAPVRRRGKIYRDV